ncbi:putative inactive receptor kinase [Dorcoceras hygrometricum]|uniref:Putative inactive receptor kinase n=1 Tax=Dorcoceras hygrometricum TaxID=472368 RepID=A0A2Z7C2S1_9LAMI|nr:putative inactive receptor kinase [Dorcoceras hygrometricum]
MGARSPVHDVRTVPGMKLVHVVRYRHATLAEAWALRAPFPRDTRHAVHAAAGAQIRMLRSDVVWISRCVVVLRDFTRPADALF